MTRSPFDRRPFQVLIAGEEFTVPFAPADLWIKAATAPAGPSGVLLELLSGPSRQRLALRLGRREITAEHMAAATREALALSVPGSEDDAYPWWVSYRLLISSALPSLAGRMVLAGLDPRDRTPAEWCYAAYGLLVQGLDTKQRFQLDAKLTAPPAGVEADDEWGEMTFDQMVAAARSAPGVR